jgi:hypothetical protein
MTTEAPLRILRDFRIDLPRLAQRSYLHGTSMFNAMLSICDQQLGAGWLETAELPSFKLIKESTGNGRFVISDEPQADVGASATLVARAAGAHVYVNFVEEGRDAKREPYNEEAYYHVVHCGDRFDGEFVLPLAGGRDDFIRGLIGANKLLHQRNTHLGGGSKKIQFLYLKSIDGRCLSHTNEACRLTIENLTVQRLPSEVRTISCVTMSAGDFSSAFRICFRAVAVSEGESAVLTRGGVGGHR